MKTVAFTTLGCRVNQYDTDAMKGLFLQNNYEDKNDLAQSLSDATRSDVVQVIGSMIVLYKESQDNKQIQLP